MGHTYSANLYHIVFSTKDRTDSIPNPSALWGYTAGITRNIGVDALAIGGTSNHVHSLLRFPPHVCVAEVTQKIKANSSRWLRASGRWNGWQEGYGSFTVSASNISAVRQYILKQPQHHAKRSFEAEFLAMLRRSGVAFDKSEVFAQCRPPDSETIIIRLPSTDVLGQALYRPSGLQGVAILPETKSQVGQGYSLDKPERIGKETEVNYPTLAPAALQVDFRLPPNERNTGAWGTRRKKHLD